MRHTRLALCLCTLLLLTACGGGGSSGSTGTPSAAPPAAGGGAPAPAPAPTPAPPPAEPPADASDQPAPPLPQATFDGEPPVAEPLSLSVRAGEALTGRVPVTDADDDIVLFQQTLPLSVLGTFEFTHPQLGDFVYRADLDAQGEELVEYQVRDQEGRFGLGSIRIDVTPAATVAGACPVDSTDFPGRVRDILVHPQDEHVLLARVDPDFSTGPRELWRSDDGGETWTELRRDVREVFLDPRDPARVWATGRTGSLRFRLLRSDDGGDSFETVFEVDPNERMSDLDVDARTGRVWLATTVGLFSAIDDRTFTPVHPDAFESVRVAGAAGNVLLVADDGGVQRSTDGGASFQRVADADRPTLEVAPPDADRVYAWRDDVLLVSSDAGATWTDRGAPGVFLFDLEADPLHPEGLLAARNLDFAESGDAGSLFEAREDGPDTFAVATARNGRKYVGLEGRLTCTFSDRVPSAAEQGDSDLTVVARLDAAEVSVGADHGLRMTLENRGTSPVTELRYELRRSGEVLRAEYDHLVESSTVEIPDRLVAVGPLADLAAGTGLALELPFDEQLPSGSWIYELTVHGLGTAPTAVRVPFVVRGPSAPTGRNLSFASADLDYQTPLLNAATPFAIIETEVGEPRRVVLDVRNSGPGPAQNVVLDVFDNLGTIDLEFFTPSQGRCTRYRDRVRCEFGTLPLNLTAEVEFRVTLQAGAAGLRALPTELSSTTPSTSALPPQEPLSDVAVRVLDAGGASGGGVRHELRITNAGPATSSNTRLVGEVGPWPQITLGDLGSLPEGCTSPLDACTGDACDALREGPATYACDVAPALSLQVAPGDAVLVPIDVRTDADATVIHAVRLGTSTREGGVADNVSALETSL